MQKIKLVTDSMCNIDSQLAQEYSIDIVPLQILIDNIEYIDGVTISSEEFLKKLTNGTDLPKTSQATYASFQTVFNKYVSEGYKVLYIGGSSIASGTYQSSQIAKEEFGTEDIYTFDTMQISVGATPIVIKAATMIKEGFSIQEILTILTEIRDNDSSKLLFFLDTLDYLKKGGRISPAIAAVGSALNMKVFIGVKDGMPVKEKVVRGKKKLHQTLLKFVEDNHTNEDIIVAYGSNKEEGTEFLNTLQKLKPNTKIIPLTICPVIASHTGPVGLGVSFLKDK